MSVKTACVKNGLLDSFDLGPRKIIKISGFNDVNTKAPPPGSQAQNFH